MSFRPSSQLSAVNIILSTIGEAPVNTLVGTLPLSASIAFAALNEQANAVQLDGYWYNTDTNVTLPLDGSGNVWLAQNVAKIEVNRLRYAGKEIVMRPQLNGQNQLYDRRNQTYNFADLGTVVADRIV